MKRERTFRSMGDIAIVPLAIVFLAGSGAHAGQPPNDDTMTMRTSLNPLHVLDETSFKNFVEKPLFDPARRLPPAAPPPSVEAVALPQATPPAPPPNVHLLGIIQGHLDLAIIGQDGDAKTQILSSGDHLGDWQVTVLPSVGLRLRNGDRVVDYALFDSGNALQSSVESGGFAVPVPLPPPAMAVRNARLQRRTY